MTTVVVQAWELCLVLLGWPPARIPAALHGAWRQATRAWSRVPPLACRCPQTPAPSKPGSNWRREGRLTSPRPLTRIASGGREWRAGMGAGVGVEAAARDVPVRSARFASFCSVRARSRHGSLTSLLHPLAALRENVCVQLPSEIFVRCRWHAAAFWARLCLLLSSHGCISGRRFRPRLPTLFPASRSQGLPSYSYLHAISRRSVLVGIAVFG